MGYILAMDESAPTPAERYGNPAEHRPAQHRFLVVGLLLAVAIGGGVAWMNQSVKAEGKMQADLRAARMQAMGGIGYPAPPAAPEPAKAPEKAGESNQ
jgi:hypothetical protein